MSKRTARFFAGSRVFAAAGLAAVLALAACGEETFDLLPPDEGAQVGGAPSPPMGGVSATGGEGLGTGGADLDPRSGGGGLASGGSEPNQPPPDRQGPTVCPYCEASGMVCDPPSGWCVPPCETDMECPGMRSHCNPDRLCVECLSNQDCVYPDRPLCVGWGVCAGCWDEQVDCVDPTKPRCQPWTLQCVECWDTGRHCLPGQYCDAATWKCVPPAD